MYPSFSAWAKHRRRDSRLRISQGVPATVLTTHGQGSALLRDLSQSGAHLRLDEPLRSGQDVMLWWLGFEAFCRVVWIAGQEAGIEFHELLPAPVLLHTRDQVDAGLAPTSQQEAYEKARAWYQGYR